MATTKTQISGYVSASTKELVERYAQAHSIKRGFLLEQALLHHLQALRELPSDIVIPTRIVVTRASGERVLKRVKRPRKPTAAMRRLFRG